MSNELKIFESEEFGAVRTTVIDGEPYFVGKDICTIFGDTHYRRSLSNIDESEKGVSQIATPGGKQTMVVINESGLYSLLFQMQPKKAKGVTQNDTLIDERVQKLKKFKHWVTSVVLPSIRKNGAYIANQENDSPEEIMAKGLFAAQKIIDEKNIQIEEMKPKALFADSVSASKTTILIGDLAKLLKQNGIEIGQKRLFQWMRDNGYLIKQNGISYNMPTQYAMERGLFEVKETTVQHNDGHTTINKTTKVTGKGQIYFVNKFLNKDTEVMVG